MIIEVKEDEETGELFIIIPEDIIDELEWNDGDILEWYVEGDSCVIRKK